MIFYICYIKSVLLCCRKSVPVVPLIQTKRPQQADASNEHVLCPVPTHRVVQLKGGSSALRRHADQFQG